MKLQEQDFKFNYQSTPFLNNPRIPQIHTHASKTVIDTCKYPNAAMLRYLDAKCEWKMIYYLNHRKNTLAGNIS